MTDTDWKVYATSLATTGAITYVLCAIFDVLFPPYGLLALLGQASPWPLSDSVAGYLAGLVTFTAAGFALGAIYAGAWRFWSPRRG